jgi:hypothetical protein
MLYCVCQNCRQVQPIHELDTQLYEVESLLDRISMGEVVPAGECNACKALASPLVSAYASFKYSQLTCREFGELPLAQQMRYADRLRLDPTDDEMHAAIAEVEGERCRMARTSCSERGRGQRNDHGDQ